MAINSIELFDSEVKLDTNSVKPKRNKRTMFEIMHMERVVARISANGKAEILGEPFMPYDLYLDVDDEDDIDILINNINNFNHWCASRVLSLDRKYAKELLNSIGVA